jgi:hypothetical protein
MYFLEPNVLSLALLAGTSAIAHDVSFRQVARQQPLGLFAPLATSFRIGLIHAVRCGQRERLRRVVSVGLLSKGREGNRTFGWW